MVPDTLTTHAAVDSAAVAGYVAPLLDTLLRNLFPGLSPDVAATIGRLGTTAATIGVLTGLRWGIDWASTKSRLVSGLIAPLWNQWRGVLNPLLALALGHMDGSALAGAMAIAVHAGYRGVAKGIGNATPQNVARSARIAVVLCAALGGVWAADAHAGLLASLLKPATQQTTPLPAFARQRFALSLGAGAQAGGWVYSRGTQGFAEMQASYQWTNAIGLRLGARRVAVSRAPIQPEARVVLTFAP